MRKEIWGCGLCLIVVVVCLLWPGSKTKPAPRPVGQPSTVLVGDGKPQSAALADVSQLSGQSAVQPSATDPAPAPVTQDPGQVQPPPAPSTNPGSSAPTPTVNPSAGSGRVYIQGDSLSSDLLPRLKKLLPGWQIDLSAQVGRHVVYGLKLLQAENLPQVVVFALGTNDYDSPESWQTAQISKVLAKAGPNRCVVLSTVWGDGAARPNVNNAVYRAAARYGPRRVQVMPWAEAVAAGRVKLVDGTHPADWQLRAVMTAEAIGRCAANL